MIQVPSSEWDMAKAKFEAEYQVMLAWHQICRPACEEPCACLMKLWDTIQHAGK